MCVCVFVYTKAVTLAPLAPDVPLRGRKCQSHQAHTPCTWAHTPHSVCTLFSSSSFWNCEASLAPRLARHPNPAAQLLTVPGTKRILTSPQSTSQGAVLEPSPETPFTEALPRSAWGGDRPRSCLAEQTRQTHCQPAQRVKDRQFPFASSPFLCFVSFVT